MQHLYLSYISPVSPLHLPSRRGPRNTSLADVKELTPEFFYLPAFLENSGGFELGRAPGRQGRGRRGAAAVGLTLTLTLTPSPDPDPNPNLP